MADAAVFGPALHQQDQGTGVRRHPPAFRDQGRVVERGDAVHRKGDRDGDAVDPQRRGRHQRHLGLWRAEGRPPELERPAGNQAVGDSSDRRLVELGRVERVLVLAQSRRQGRRIYRDDNVHLGHRHTEGRALPKISARAGEDLGLGQHGADLLPDAGGQAPHRSVAGLRGPQLLHQLLHGRLEDVRAEAWSSDRPNAPLPHLFPPSAGGPLHDGRHGQLPCLAQGRGQPCRLQLGRPDKG
mmetsp:Transcript_84953/g.216402  ORF Transcript_84953/g.216402 Transcript_84953/m.216402 type:complete len:241 (+) Transcript_84953:666-1388(+)